MRSYPECDEVLVELGEKFVNGCSRAVRLAREDYVLYRKTFPLWVAQACERGLANWIHDRLWARLAEVLDSIADVAFVDQEPKREIFVGTKYRLRLKRHQAATGAISYHHTLGGVEFWSQETSALEGLEEVRLAVGYAWEPDTRDIGAPVLSLHDAGDDPVWYRHLPAEPGASEGVVSMPTTPPGSGPQSPRIDVGFLGKDLEEES